jgi:hypothetical protein
MITGFKRSAIHETYQRIWTEVLRFSVRNKNLLEMVSIDLAQGNNLEEGIQRTVKSLNRATSRNEPGDFPLLLPVVMVFGLPTVLLTGQVFFGHGTLVPLLTLSVVISLVLFAANIGGCRVGRPSGGLA